MAFFVCVIGMVMIVEGTPYFASPARLKAMMREIGRLPDHTLRRWGLLMMIGGLVLVYAGKHGWP
jgi:uncharacterized protein YjeT (DUF2065 family)